jgi:hypothetical protein
MVENAQCSNNKCPMYKSGFTKNCISCIYRTNNATQNNTSNINQKTTSNFNNIRTSKKSTGSNENFKNVTEDISSMTYNYGEELNIKEKLNDQFDDIPTVYNTQSNFEDFYKVHSKKKINSSSILLILSIFIIFSIFIYIFLKFL